MKEAEEGQSCPFFKLSTDVLYLAVMNDLGWLDVPTCVLYDTEETNVLGIAVGP
jgi:hypothetical protein